MSATDTRRDAYRSKGGGLGESYYSLASTLSHWESGGCGKVAKRDVRALRARLARAAKALDAAEAALKAAYAVTRES